MNVSNEDNSSDLAEDDIDASQRRTSSVGKVEARTEVEELKEEINHYFDLLEEERGRNRELAFELAATKAELAAAEKKGESQFRNSGGESQFRNSGSQSNIDDSMREPRALPSGIDDSMRGAGINEFKRRLSDVQSLEESDISTNNDEDDDLSALTGEYVQTLQEENEELRREVDELKANKDDVSDMSNDGDFFKQVEREKLQKQLSMAKEKVSSLQDYVELLEQNRDAVEVELENARQEAEKNAELVEKLQTDVYEQKLALTEMANLLEEQEKDHADVIVRLKNDHQISEQDPDPTAKDEAIAKLEVENAQLREEADNQVALATAMKVELQNALNELAELKR
jgi:chromosome segregation ATPase